MNGIRKQQNNSTAIGFWLDKIKVMDIKLSVLPSCVGSSQRKSLRHGAAAMTGTNVGTVDSRYLLHAGCTVTLIRYRVVQLESGIYPILGFR